MNDPAQKYEEVRARSGDAEAARSLIRSSKRMVGIFIVGSVALVAVWLGTAVYASGRINNCRDLVEDRYMAGIGDVLVEYRETGGLSETTLDDFKTRRDAVNDITGLCPSAFLPWDLPSEPNLPPSQIPHGRSVPPTTPTLLPVPTTGSTQPDS